MRGCLALRRGLTIVRCPKLRVRISNTICLRFIQITYEKAIQEICEQPARLSSTLAFMFEVMMTGRTRTPAVAADDIRAVSG